MQHNKLTVLIIFQFLFFGICNGQNIKAVDSLWAITINSNNKVDQAKAFVELSELLGNNYLDTLPYLCNKAISLIENDYKLSSNKNSSIAYNTLGLAYNNLGFYTAQKIELKKALPYFEKSLVYYKKGENYDLKLSSLTNLGITYKNLGEYKKSVIYFDEMLQLATLEKKAIGIASALQSIAVIHYALKDYNTSVLYGKRSLKIANENNFNKEKVAALSIIGNTYSNLNMADSALVYLLEAKTLVVKSKSWRTISIIYNNLGKAYNALDQKDSAYYYLLKAIELSEKNKAPSSQLSAQYNNLCRMLAKDKKFEEAIVHGEKAYQYAAQSGNIKDMYQAKEILNVCYEKTGNYKAAFYSIDEFIKLKDSTLSESNKRALIKREYDIEAKILSAKLKIEADEKIKRNTLVFTFEQEKQKFLLLEEKRGMMQKETLKRKQLEKDFNQKQQVELLLKEKRELKIKEESKRQYLILFSISVLFILLALFAYILLRRLKIINKQKDLINKQKIVVETQKHIVDEKHKEITDSINYAERIQRSLLASKELLVENLKDYFVFFQPKDVVSGDFYWANKLSNGDFVLVTADSTGHGVPGAIMSILNISCIKETIKEGILNPSEILDNTRKLVIDTLKKDGSEDGGKDGMDCSLLSFNFNKNELTYSAANNPVWIVRSKEILELKPDKMPVGKHEKDNIPFTQHTIELQKGDIVYAITDGMSDQFGGPKGKKFMYKQLKELLISIATLSMREQKEMLSKSLNNWKGSLEQVDDVCVIGVRI